jgi:hypothetical protein
MTAPVVTDSVECHRLSIPRIPTLSVEQSFGSGAVTDPPPAVQQSDGTNNENDDADGWMYRMRNNKNNKIRQQQHLKATTLSKREVLTMR